MRRIILILNLAICYLTSFSQQIGTFKDTRDGKVYKTVKIGTQEWFAENLSYKASSGCWAYNNDISNVTKYGYLYNWETAKLVCPVGWHLPSKSDFVTLYRNVKGVGSVYQALIPGGSSGFSAPFGGWRYRNARFQGIRRYARFWSSSSGGEIYAFDMGIHSLGTYVDILSDDRSCGFSVRCLQDN